MLYLGFSLVSGLLGYKKQSWFIGTLVLLGVELSVIYGLVLVFYSALLMYDRTYAPDFTFAIIFIVSLISYFVGRAIYEEINIRRIQKAADSVGE